MTTNIYVLKLQGGNYYIGKSNDVIGRYQEHLQGNGSAWTRKYTPLSLVESRDNVSPFEEDKVTKEYMAKYGIDKVRGGSYVSEALDDEQRYSVQKEIWAATDCCTQCGRKGHFARDCNSKVDITGKYMGKPIGRPISKPTPTCYTCGRVGHYASTCYAKNSSRYYSDSDSDSELESDWDSESDSD